MTNDLDSISKPNVSTLNPFKENSDVTNSKPNKEFILFSTIFWISFSKTKKT